MTSHGSDQFSPVGAGYQSERRIRGSARVDSLVAGCAHFTTSGPEAVVDIEDGGWRRKPAPTCLPPLRSRLLRLLTARRLRAGL
jgi:hypothetical protein